MSYEKYIKYKTKYLNLKNNIHNQKIQLDGAKNISDNDFIQTLGSTPNSDVFNTNYNLVGGTNDLNVKSSSSSEKSSSEKSSSEKSLSDNLPNKLSSSEKSLSDNLPNKLSSSEKLSSEKSSSEKLSSEKSSSKKLSSKKSLSEKLSSKKSLSEKLSSEKSLSSENNKSKEQYLGGSRKLKNKNVFSESDSDFNNSESSLLSFSTTVSESSE
jgi:hypothetical protein